MAAQLEYIAEEEILKLHDDLIEVSGGVKGILRPSNVGWITESVKHIDDQTLPGVASYLLAYIAKGHPFIDGNKRAAYFATRYFLMRNGADFNGTNPEEASNEIEAIASQSDMKSAHSLSRQLCDRYIQTGSVKISDYDTFYRLIIKSIGVAEILAKR